MKGQESKKVPAGDTPVALRAPSVSPAHGTNFKGNGKPGIIIVVKGK